MPQDAHARPRAPRALPVIEDACAPGASALLPIADADRAATLFKALGDPVRVRLLAHIAAANHGTTCACHLPAALGIAQPTLSHHLKRLVEAGLISREQRGRWAHYTVVPDALAGVLSLLRGLGSSDAAS